MSDTPIFAPDDIPSPPGDDRVSKLLAAGFSQEEVGAWAARKRDALTSAGFGQPEVDGYIGNKPRLSEPFFDRMVQGAKLKPDQKPDMLSELYRGAVRGGASLLYGVEDFANMLERRIVEGPPDPTKAWLPGLKSLAPYVSSDTAALEERKAATAQAYAPSVKNVGEAIQGPDAAAHYVLGKVGEAVPAIAEFVAMGVPRMVLLGAITGAARAAQENGGDAGATAAGAAIGAAAAGAPAPFLSGAVGKGMLDTIARSIAGMATVGAAQTFAEPVPAAVAGKGYQPPSLADIAEGAATGGIGGAVFGAFGALGRSRRAPMGDPGEEAIGGLPRGEEFNAAAKATLGPAAPPEAHSALEKLYAERGIHPAEAAHDAMGDVTITQDLAAGKVPRAYSEHRVQESTGQAKPPVLAERGAPFARPPAVVAEPVAPAVPTSEMPQLRTFAPGELKVDAKRFQFKEGGDAAGVTERLQGVTQWDPLKAGLTLVYEDRAGNSWIADGHQRLGLAQRIEQSDPAQQPRLNAWVLREADGITDADVRAIAAGKNIAEGTGTAVDAAKVLRDRPDLMSSLPPRSELVRQARGLMNLDKGAFGKIVNDVVPANYGAIVGRLVPEDAKMQNALVDLLAKTHPENAVQAESIVRQGMDAGLHSETQATLFGDQEVVSSLYTDRARILDRALKQLKRDRTVFQSIVENSAIIEDLGNQLARDANARRAAVDGHASQIIQTLANRRGSIGDALTASARAVGDKRVDLAAATRDFVAEIRRQAESGDLTRIADGGSRSDVAVAGKGAAEPSRVASPALEAKAAEQATEAIRAGVEQTNQGAQLIIPGAERSAQQAVAARDAAGHGRIAPPAAQEEPGGLFAPAEKPQPGLFSQIAKSEAGTLRLKEEMPRTDAEKSILSHLSVGEKDIRQQNTWDRFYTKMVDRLNPIPAVDAEGNRLPTAENPYELARLYAGVAGKAEQFIRYGTFKFGTDQNTGESLRSALSGEKDLDGFRAFASSLHALELEQNGIKTGFDLDAARTVVKDGAKQYAPTAAKVIAYQDRVLQYLVDSGVVSKDGAAAMRDKYKFYVPSQRIFGDLPGDIVPTTVGGRGKTLQATDPIKGIKGSERVEIDPLESIVKNTFLATMMAERNAVGTKLLKFLGTHASPDAEGQSDTISIYRDGKRETHKVDADLAAAMKGLNEESVNTIIRMLAPAARGLRAGATLTPDFMARNLIRDFSSAMVNTTKGVFSPADTFRGLMSAINKDENFQSWLKGGGASAAVVSLDRRYLQENLRAITEETGLANRAWNVVAHPIDTLRTVSELSEQSTRLGEFIARKQQLLAEGATEQEANRGAAFASREVTIDFARRGAMTQGLNMITAFWNARVQGMDRLVRQFKENPVGTGLKIAAGVTVPSVLLWVANHDDPRWQEIPGWERDLFWIWMTKDHIYRIPKPPEIGLIFGSGVERALDAFYDKRPDAFRSFANQIWGQVIGNVTPTAAQPILEQWANRSSFTDRTLVPDGLEKGLPEYQYTPYTTETAKKLGQIMGAFPGLNKLPLGDEPFAGVARAIGSPILAENYVRAWTGGLGFYVLQASDYSLRKSGLLPDPPKPDDTLADMPFVKAFAVRYPSGSAESIQNFYDDYDKNRKYFASYQAKAKEGDIAAMQHIQQMGGLKIFVQLDSIKKTLADQSQYIRNVYKDPSMSSSDKRQLIDTAYMRQTEIARLGNDVMRRVDAALTGR